MSGIRAKVFVYLFALGVMMPANFESSWAALGVGLLIVAIGNLVHAAVDAHNSTDSGR